MKELLLKIENAEFTERTLTKELHAKIEKKAFRQTRLQKEFILKTEKRALREYMEKIPLTLLYAL